MVANPGGDELFRDPAREWHTPDHVDLDSGAWTLTYGTDAYRDLREAYLTYLDAGGKRQDWKAYQKRMAAQGSDLVSSSLREKAAALASRAVAAATGARVKVPVRIPPSVEVAYVPLSAEEASEGWEEWPERSAPTPAAPARPVEPRRAPITHETPPVSTPELQPAAPPASEHRSNRWSDALGIHKHRRMRPSQTPAGRRRRYIRAVAAKENISIKKAEQLHPPRHKEPQPCH